MCKVILPGIYLEQHLIAPCGSLQTAVVLSIIKFLYKSRTCIYRDDPEAKGTPIYLSLAQLAEFACVSCDTIRRSLKHLSAMGIIQLKARKGQKYSIQPLIINKEAIMALKMLDLNYSKMAPCKLQGVPLANSEGSGIYTYDIIYTIYYNMCFELYINDPAKVGVQNLSVRMPIRLIGAKF